MTQKQQQFLIKSIAVKSAELVECIQWNAVETDRIEVRKIANELARLTQELLEETE
jgi:hypothetical protein